MNDVSLGTLVRNVLDSKLVVYSPKEDKSFGGTLVLPTQHEKQNRVRFEDLQNTTRTGMNKVKKLKGDC